MNIAGLRFTRKLSLLAGGAFVSSTLFAGLAVAQTPVNQTASATPQNSATSNLAEVVVTASKRKERLIDTPQSVTVLSGRTLTANGATHFSDWANSVPGLTFTTQGAGFSEISLRGVTTGNDIGATVATYVDDVAFGNSTPGVNNGNFTFDPGLFDIDSIEVLRGPQGTLYGASTLGGLIKYVTPLPNTNVFSGHVRAGISGNENGGIGYNGSAVVNIPLIKDLAALRVSGFYTHDGGYINNVTLNQKNVDQANVYGGRFDLLVKPMEGLTVRLNYFTQNIYRNGQETADFYDFGGTHGGPVVGPYDQERKVEEPFDQRFRLGSAEINYNLGQAALTSVTSYQTQRSQTVSDTSAVYAPYCAYAGASCAEAEVPNRNYLNKFTEELRLASNQKQLLEWTLGAYYTREVGDPFVGITGLNASSQPVIVLLAENLPSLYEEGAGFGDVTLHVTDKLELTGGVRFFHDHQTEGQEPSIGLFGSVIPPRASDESAITYLGNASYHISPNDQVYLRYATGYRPGGPTVFSYVGAYPTGVPTSYLPDTLKSYELGWKAEFFDRRLAIDADAFHINWDNIHNTGTVDGFSFIVNSGNATINGTEVSLTARVTPDLTIQGSVTYDNAYLATANANLGGYAGERLPNVPRFNMDLGADYSIPWGALSDYAPSIGFTARYITNRYGSFDDSATYHQAFIPAYTNVDLRASATVQNVTLQFFVHNLTNAVEQQSAFTEYSAPNEAEIAVLPPRTYGVNATYPF